MDTLPGDFDRARVAGIGRLFLLARRDFVFRLREKLQPTVDLQALGGGSALLPYIDAGGTRSTDIVLRAGMSRQATAKGLKSLEDAGLIRREVDACDARAHIVTFTPKGVDMLLRLQDAVKAVEADYAAKAGGERVLELKRTLALLIA